ncbi:sterile alpha motif domain-containing protein [Naegleria gruberi]|uniref:Sterile alpha motif domain-containing protein n=1 Tax=Naegleria gruberi TaxID=5762 RepID=D2UX43_NAEGR|nr:sterile alpha motif domain-containing protein [Naegleria gruberi]EFC50558.1 sterile alpha motif domain-containing protein [Naegleria gruberi]|eukprot:XP_002683302.1 sterile alpha motif domain-containing protein [Naegleria gruberi strain NEG-M]
MRPLLLGKHSTHSNSVGTFQQQDNHHQYIYPNNNNGLSNNNQLKSNSPNSSHDNMTPLLLKNRMTAPKAIDKEISKWSCQDVGIWLDWMKLSHLKPIFIQNQISGDELLELTDAEIINDLKVRDEYERKLIKELIDNREVWMKRGSKKLSNDSLDSLEEYPKPISPINMSPQAVKYQVLNQKPIFPNTKSSLELDEFSDCDDLTSVGGIFLDRSTIASQKLEVLLETLYKDVGNVKFKVYRGSDIYLITQKRSQLSFTSLKLEIIERYQCVKPTILYKTRDGDFIIINRDEDLARVISSYHQNGGDVRIATQIPMPQIR